MPFARRLLYALGAVLLVAALVFTGSPAASAEESDPVTVTIQVSPESLTAPGKVNVSLRVSNPTDTDMIAPVTLFDPAGNLVASFGDGGSYVLKSGDSRSWEGEWNVTQAELDAGAVSYTLRYHLEDESGALVELSRQATARIQFAGERVNLSVNRTIRPEVVRQGGQAQVSYELYNNGNVELTDIRVQEKISKQAQTVKSLPAGERKTLTFTSRMGSADLVSNASITYKASGSSQTQKITVEDAPIPLAKPNLKIELSSPTAGVNVGEAATLVITFVNAGNVAYSNVTLTEAKKGEILTNISIPAGATVTEQKEFILREPTDFKVTATLPDNTGETRTLSSNEIRIGVFDPEKQMLLTLNLTSDQETVPKVPADVKFHLTVTNNSNIKAEKIAITHGSTPIYTINSLEPGASVTLDRDVRISQAGQFRFTATVTDTMNNKVTFDSNTLAIGYAPVTNAPTMVPVVTVAPPVLVTPSPVEPLLGQGRSALMTAAVVLGGLFGCALVLFAVSTIVRLRNKSKSNAAYDHLDLAERRDYTEPADDEPDEEETYTREPETEEVADVAEQTEKPEEPVLPHEKVISAVQAEAEKAPAPADMLPQDGEGGYRVSRANVHEAIRQELMAADAKDAARKAAAAEPQAPADTQPRRRRRSSRTEDGE